MKKTIIAMSAILVSGVSSADDPLLANNLRLGDLKYRYTRT